VNLIYRALRPALFRLPAEPVHHATSALLSRVLASDALRRRVRRRYLVDDAALRVPLWGICFPNPVGLAAGFDKAGTTFNALGALGFGFVEIGTVTALAQPGNDPPRLFLLPRDQALLNRLGFNNPGADALAERLATTPIEPILGINLGKSKVTPLEHATDDYLHSLERLHRFARYLVINVSSPNTPGLRELQDARPLRELLRAIRTRVNELAGHSDRTSPPILLKIAPDLTDPQVDQAVEIAQEEGVSGIVATNTTVSREALRTPAARVEAAARRCGNGHSGSPRASFAAPGASSRSWASAGSCPPRTPGHASAPARRWSSCTPASCTADPASCATSTSDCWSACGWPAPAPSRRWWGATPGEPHRVMIRAARLLLALARQRHRIDESEIRLASPQGDRPATLLRPRGTGPTPAWIVLQGLTIFGRQHPTLMRFARALCSSGATVLVPEISEWTALQMRTPAVARAVVAAADFLHATHPGSEGGVGVVGFSFGATQGLVAASEEEVRDRVRVVVGFGGYCEMHRLARFMMTGEHEWKGTRYRLHPDPYARWIVAGNYLAAVPGMERMQRVGEFALELAREAGRSGLGTPETDVDPLKAELRARLGPEERRVWDLLAPPAGVLPADRVAAAELGAALADAALAADPRLDPLRALPHLRARPVLAHGSTDRLIPFTETLRLAESLPPHLRTRATITRLFEHSVGATGLGPRAFAVEAWLLFRLLNTVLHPHRPGSGG
jgi:dihydroorotate dehydrogenase